jgi:hypothetical protein
VKHAEKRPLRGKLSTTWGSVKSYRVKAILPEACATSPIAGFSSQRREVRKSRPPGHPTYRMAKASWDHSLLGTREMTGRR